MVMAWAIFFPAAMLGARYLKQQGGPLYIKARGISTFIQSMDQLLLRLA